MRYHIADEVLREYAANRVDQETSARVRAHLDTGCARCSGEVSFWCRSMGGLQLRSHAGASEAGLQRAFALFDRFSARLASSHEGGWWERIVARLAFDSRVAPALVGARDGAAQGSEDGTSFQLLFEAEGTDIDLLCEPTEDGWQIIGQALAVDAPELAWKVSATPAASDGAMRPVETEADAMGEFHLGGLAPGVYDLTLRLGSREVILPGVEFARVSLSTMVFMGRAARPMNALAAV